LGECFVSFNWISGEGLTAALAIMGNLRVGDIKVEAAHEQLRELRLTPEQVAAKLAQQQDAPTAVSLARHDYKILLAKSKEKKATKARLALELAQTEEADSPSANGDEAGSELTGRYHAGSECTDRDQANSEQRRVTVPIEVEHRDNQVVCSPETSVAVARTIDAHQQNEDTRALLKRMNEADQMHALFKAEPRTRTGGSNKRKI
jgi:hypothetical protein